MTIPEIAEVIHEEAETSGNPLPMDICQRIAMRITCEVIHPKDPPGHIAQHCRDRYED